MGADIHFAAQERYVDNVAYGSEAGILGLVFVRFALDAT